jgi:protein transport protein SEC24
MLVMSDVDDVFLPKPNDLLVNLSECRAGVESLLGRLNDMFTDNHTIGSALGPALQSGFKLIVRFPARPKACPNSFPFSTLESHWW